MRMNSKAANETRTAIEPPSVFNTAGRTTLLMCEAARVAMIGGKYVRHLAEVLLYCMITKMDLIEEHRMKWKTSLVNQYHCVPKHKVQALACEQ